MRCTKARYVGTQRLEACRGAGLQVEWWWCSRVSWAGGCVYVYTTADVWAQVVGAVRKVVGVGDGNE